MVVSIAQGVAKKLWISIKKKFRIISKLFFYTYQVFVYLSYLQIFVKAVLFHQQLNVLLQDIFQVKRLFELIAVSVFFRSL